MPVQELIAMGASLAAIFVAVAALNYLVIRLAVRAEILGLKNEVSEKYVTKETCQAIRRDCPARQRAINHGGKAAQGG